MDIFVSLLEKQERMLTVPLLLPSGYRTVDALLQRMFEAEIPPEDEGPSLEEILNLPPAAAGPTHLTSERAV